MSGLHGLILSSRQIEINTPSGVSTELIYQGRLADGRRFHWRVTQPRICFFVPRQAETPELPAFRKQLPLTDLRFHPVDGLYFQSAPDFYRARNRMREMQIPLFESDVSPLARHLMERWIRATVYFPDPPEIETDGMVYFANPKVEPSTESFELKLLSFDIECSLDGRLFSISLTDGTNNDVLMVGNQSPSKYYRSLPGEKQVLQEFFHLVKERDPDCFIGWNVVGFDLLWLSRKCDRLNIPFEMGTDGPCEMIEPGGGSDWVARIPGRCVLDGIIMCKTAFIQLEDYSLATASRQLLGDAKLVETSGTQKAEELEEMYLKDPESLARYNLKDSQLVLEIFQKFGLHKLAVNKARLTGLPVDRAGGSAAAFDFLYLPHLHRKGFVADTFALPGDGTQTPGGMVLEGEAGFHENVAVLDFRSLYPSIMRTFSIDPLAAIMARKHSPKTPSPHMINPPVGITFDARHAILPGILDELWEERARARNDQDPILTQAVKIIMNSFYGVLGSPGCRFFDTRLASTITGIGRWALLTSKEFFMNQSIPVVYGDTDSVFLRLGSGDPEELSKKALSLADDLNRFLSEKIKQECGVSSRLEAKFEKLFIRFFLPSLRGEEKVSKKRYAGMIWNSGEKDSLHFVGMEFNRSDWTDLAHEFQKEIFSIAFAHGKDQVLSPLRECVLRWNKQLYSGELNHMLVYRKGISKPLHTYQKNVPPHIRAARKIAGFRERHIRYVITPDGPEPVSGSSDPEKIIPDYEHYAGKQLAPVANMLLRNFGTKWEEVVSGGEQLSLL